jgi:hypothetical protein
MVSRFDRNLLAAIRPTYPQQIDGFHSEKQNAEDSPSAVECFILSELSKEDVQSRHNEHIVSHTSGRAAEDRK